MMRVRVAGADGGGGNLKLAASAAGGGESGDMPVAAAKCER